MIAAPVFAQGGLNPQGAAREGTHSFDAADHDVVLAQVTSGGSVDAGPLGEDCVGRIDARPNVIINVTHTGRTRFEVSSSRDTTLVVTTPSGRVLCNDDADGQNPGMVLMTGSGTYRVWVGAFNAEDAGRARLTVRSTRGPITHQGDATTPTAGQANGQAPTPQPASAPQHQRAFSGARLGFSATAGGPIPADTVERGCSGYVTTEPTATITTSDAKALRIAFTAERDTTLVVRTPSGNTLCNDDGDGQNPVIATPGEAGAFQIWAGTYSEGGSASGRLQITEASTAEAAGLSEIPRPAQRNGNLERQIFGAIRAAAAQNWTETPVFAFLSSDSWRYRRSPTGRVTGRYRGAWIGATWPDGHCTVQEFDFIQQGTGRRFSGPFRTFTTGSQLNVECADLERTRRRLRNR